MHPILARKGRLGPYLAAWVPLAGLLAGLAHAAAGTPWPEALVLAIPLTTVYAFICLAAFYPCRAVPLGTARLPQVLATHALAALLSALLWLFLALTWAALLEQVPLFAGATERLPRYAAILLAAAFLLYTLAAALHYLVIAFEREREAEKRELSLTILARDAELKALRAQVDPHFLFNAMNSIASLTGSDPAAARRMCLSLAEFLRDCLRLGGQDEIPLAEEVALAEKYLAVERARFGARLRVEREVGEGVASWPVPPLILQPLVENAINRGIANLLDGGFLRIAAHPAGEGLAIVIENSFDPEAPVRGGGGLGLANVRARLAARYGEQSRVEVQQSGAVFRVRLELPAAQPERGGGTLATAWPSPAPSAS